MATNEERRLRSEEKLLQAFDTILSRDGLSKLKVNAIVKEAGVGKGLLYDYFDSLDGLAKAWVKWTKFYPSQRDVTQESLEDFSKRSRQDQIGHIYRNYAAMIKNNPVAVELLRTEVMTAQSLSPILKQIKNRIGQTHEDLFMSVPYFGRPEVISVLMVLHAATNYIALRESSEPNFNGIQLDTEEGWEMMMGMIDQVAKLLTDDTDEIKNGA